MAAAAIFKNQKIAIYWQRFNRSPRNLAWWVDDAFWPSPPLDR